MIKRLLFGLFFPLAAFGSEANNNGDVEQFFDSALHYHLRQNYTDALTNYTAFIDGASKSIEPHLQSKIIRALLSSANIHDHFGDYQSAYELALSALHLCEENKCTFKPEIYRSMGNIVYRLGDFKLAKSHYISALELCEDSLSIASLLNNIGVMEMEIEEIDSAFLFANRSLRMFKQYSGNDDLYFQAIVFTTFATIYEKIEQLDSTLYYYELSLDYARKTNRTEVEAEILSDLGRLYLKNNNLEKSESCTKQSNNIAEINRFLRIQCKNYLTLSKIAEIKGNKTLALQFLHQHIDLKDSIQNSDILSNINQLQYRHEAVKTKQQINELVLLHQMEARKVRFQRIFLLVIGAALLLLGGILALVFFQHRELNKAYSMLVEKNIETIDLQNNTSHQYKTVISNDVQNELADKILAVMETPVVYDLDFTVDKLAELVQSNQTYVSQTINVVMKKNFRQFVCAYRIREAQRLFSEPGANKYTVDTIATQVGFKSRSTFYAAFKEITGVTPNFYLKTAQERL